MSTKCKQFYQIKSAFLQLFIMSWFLKYKLKLSNLTSAIYYSWKSMKHLQSTLKTKEDWNNIWLQKKRKIVENKSH